jgi:hypothetical protein
MTSSPSVSTIKEDDESSIENTSTSLDAFFLRQAKVHFGIGTLLFLCHSLYGFFPVDIFKSEKP